MPTCLVRFSFLFSFLFLFRGCVEIRKPVRPPSDLLIPLWRMLFLPVIRHLQPGVNAHPIKVHQPTTNTSTTQRDFCFPISCLGSFSRSPLAQQSLFQWLSALFDVKCLSMRQNFPSFLNTLFVHPPHYLVISTMLVILLSVFIATSSISASLLSFEQACHKSSS